MEDLAMRLDNLKKEIDKTKSKTITLKANAEKEEEILRDLVREIKELGFNPKSLKEDLEKMERDIEQSLIEKEKEVQEVKNVLENIERNVKSHEII
jgi:uncharacterized coiled-coil DUF342 family protein